MSTDTTNTFAENIVPKTSSESYEEYLAFISEGLNFVINASVINQIIMNNNITPMPRLPDFIRGIINLRGQVIPIVDVCMRMNRPATELTEETCIIVIDVNDMLIGLMVDKVSHVVNIPSSDIRPAPTKNAQELINQMVRIGDVDYMILDYTLLAAPQEQA